MQLAAAGMDDLIVSDLADYEQKAIEFAKHPDRCAATREQIICYVKVDIAIC